MSLNAKNRKILALIPDIAFFTLVAAIAIGDYVCPFYFIFGIACPGCGITRATKAALSLDFKAAFEYNCLFPLAFFWAAYQLFRKRIALSKPKETIMLTITGMLFLIRWFIILFIH